MIEDLTTCSRSEAVSADPCVRAIQTNGPLFSSIRRLNVQGRPAEIQVVATY